MAISYHNYLAGSIFANITATEGSEEASTIMIAGRDHINRAIHGDIVAVELLPRSEWKRLGDDRVLDQDKDEEKEEDEKIMDLDQPEVEENAMEVVEDGMAPLIPTGRVVGIIKKNWRPYCGTIEKPKMESSGTSAEMVNFWALDKRIPKIRIRTRQVNKLVGKRIIVQIDSWGQTSMHPSGHFVKVLGEVGDKETETEMLLLEHDVPYLPFSVCIKCWLITLESC
jgi:exosome complex exonuclease DIS3/RRP44